MTQLVSHVVYRLKIRCHHGVVDLDVVVDAQRFCVFPVLLVFLLAGLDFVVRDVFKQLELTCQACACGSAGFGVARSSCGVLCTTSTFSSTLDFLELSIDLLPSTSPASSIHIREILQLPLRMPACGESELFSCSGPHFERNFLLGSFIAS